MRGKKGMVGWILFGFSLLLFLIFCVFYYIPKIQQDVTDTNAITVAMVVGLGCGIVGTIGLLIEKR